MKRIKNLNLERMKHEKHFFRLSVFATLIIIGLGASQIGINNPLYNSAEAAKRQESLSNGILQAKNIISEGKASFYSDEFHGRKTANGETFNMGNLTAAHPSLPFGTWVRVTNLRNGKDVVVRINDRGPFIKGRVIDLSISAAKEIGLIKSGTTQVKLEALESKPSSFISG